MTARKQRAPIAGRGGGGVPGRDGDVGHGTDQPPLVHETLAAEALFDERPPAMRPDRPPRVVSDGEGRFQVTFTLGGYRCAGFLEARDETEARARIPALVDLVLGARRSRIRALAAVRKRAPAPAR